MPITIKMNPTRIIPIPINFLLDRLTVDFPAEEPELLIEGAFGVFVIFIKLSSPIKRVKVKLFL